MLGHKVPDNNCKAAEHQHVTHDQDRPGTNIWPTHLSWEARPSHIPPSDDYDANCEHDDLAPTNAGLVQDEPSSVGQRGRVRITTGVTTHRVRVKACVLIPALPEYARTSA